MLCPEVQKFLDTLPKKDWSTFIPHSMPPKVLEVYLKLPVEKRESAFNDWIRITLL